MRFFGVVVGMKLADAMKQPLASHTTHRSQSKPNPHPIGIIGSNIYAPTLNLTHKGFDVSVLNYRQRIVVGNRTHEPCVPTFVDKKFTRWICLKCRFIIISIIIITKITWSSNIRCVVGFDSIFLKQIMPNALVEQFVILGYNVSNPLPTLWDSP